MNQTCQHPVHPEAMTSLGSGACGQIAQVITTLSQNSADRGSIANHSFFSNWAGVSPQEFSHFLTKAYVQDQVEVTKQSLKLDPGKPAIALDFIEKSAVKAVDIRYGFIPSPFGECLVGITQKGICYLKFLGLAQREQCLEQFQLAWPTNPLKHDQQAIAAVGDRLFLPGRDERPGSIQLHVVGTEFQRQVWQAAIQIPFGGILTYQGLAMRMGRPTAARAVGNALSNNPVGYLIPCHRVVRGDGALGGFRWGLALKQILLGWEASHALTSKPHYSR